MKQKRVLILGSTGSIGLSTLEVIRKSDGYLKVVGLTAHTNSKSLYAQAQEFEGAKTFLSSETKDVSGEELARFVRSIDFDIIMVAIVGFAALKPTMAAVEMGKTIALANKEVLVTGGELLTSRAKTTGAQIIPVDSEHNALFQALQGHSMDNVAKLIITASGGPFLGKTKDELSQVTIEQALKHPKWKMGPKITIDSATLMNKGLEVIETCHLFGVTPDRVDVIVHPQSIIHGMVEFIDGTVLAHMGPPDMKAAISHALYFPKRQAGAVKPLNLLEIKTLSFEPVDHETFPCVNLARHAFGRGGIIPTVLNAANEVAVDAFLKGELTFNNIPKVINEVTNATQSETLTLDHIFNADRNSRNWTREKIELSI